MAIRTQDTRRWLGVADGTAVVASTTDHFGCTVMNTVSKSGTSTLTFDTTEPGIELVGNTSGAAYLEWTDLAASDEFTAMLEGTGWGGTISGTPRVIDLRTAGNGNVARLEIDSNGRIGLYDGAGTQRAYSGTSQGVDNGTGGWRVAVTGKVSTTKIRAALYVENDGRGTTPLWDTGELSTAVYTNGGPSWARFGKTNTATAVNFTIRNFAANTTYGLLSPIVPAPTGLWWDGAALHWTAVAGASAYKVEKDGSVVATGVTGTSWTDSGASAGVGHRYRVAVDS